MDLDVFLSPAQCCHSPALGLKAAAVYSLSGVVSFGGRSFKDVPGCSVTSTLAMLTPMSSPQSANSFHTGWSCWHAGHQGA